MNRYKERTPHIQVSWWQVRPPTRKTRVFANKQVGRLLPISVKQGAKKSPTIFTSGHLAKMVMRLAF